MRNIGLLHIGRTANANDLSAKVNTSPFLVHLLEQGSSSVNFLPT
jgi:hypothetical protein